MTSLVCTLVCVGQRCGVDWQAFRAKPEPRPAGDGHHAYKWQNTNPLIGKYAGAIGIKTGDTKAAGNAFDPGRPARPHLTITLRHNKHDLVGFGGPALSAEHGPDYSH